MAETWRARLLGEAGVTKPVLIKKVLPEYANDQNFTAMFISEARISAMLSHGGIAQVYDFGRVDGEYFLAMEYVDGQPLHRIVRRAIRTGLASIPAPLAAFIAIEMCRGLHYAHTRRDESGRLLGIVHRDISPDNVLVSYEGQVKIVDFGIAKAREMRGLKTEPGIVKGKFLFFSPEQARGEEVDARTDVWATGVVLYEMVCGKLPVEGPQYVVLTRLVKGEFPPPRELNPELPNELNSIIMRALSVDREKRFDSCHDLEDALVGFLNSIAPRFSAITLSHFVEELFRNDLSDEGRSVQVPRSFLEQLALWRGAPQPTIPLNLAAPQASPLPEAGVLPTVRLPPPPTRSAMLWGMGFGVALSFFLLALGFITFGKSSSPSLQSTPTPAQVREPLRTQEEAAQALSSQSPPITTTPTPSASIPITTSTQTSPAVVDSKLDLPHETSTQKHFAITAPSESKDTSNETEAQGHEIKIRDASSKPTLSSPDEQSASRAPTPGASPTMPANPGPIKSPAYKAQEDLSATNTNKPADAQALLREIRTAFTNQHFLDAANLSEKCIQTAPNNPDCYLLSGSAYAGLNQGRKAVERYRALLKMAPNHKSAQQVTTNLRAWEIKLISEDALKFYNANNYQKSAAYSENCLSLDQNNVECHMLAGASYAYLGQSEMAVAHYRAFLKLAPNHKSASATRQILEKFEKKK